MPISQSVGKGGKNARPDVKYVQALLNVWRDKKKLPLLKVDGIAGPKTTAAIQEFQGSKIGPYAGLVNPNSETFKQLEEQIASLSRELKAYITLAMALSYDPNPEKPHSSTAEFLAMTNPLLPRRG
jgi:peptidoglycan hydrolase-like protein with peptidoglycan-binding domain